VTDYIRGRDANFAGQDFDPAQNAEWRKGWETAQYGRDLMDEYEQGDDPDEEAEFDCGMMADGQCLKAGSEECEWICPRNQG